MLEELFCAHRAELTAYCRGLCRSDAAAQDMVQEVFLRAWQNIGTLQDLGPSQRRAWLYRTARNLFVEAMRRAAREAAGRLACLLAERADCVVQMFCGLPTVLKGELPPC